MKPRNGRSDRRLLPVHVLALLASLLPLERGTAQEFSRYLTCSGTFRAVGDSPRPAHADLAMRFNNQTVVIQRSNVLPVGERLDYTATPINYGMTYRLPRQGTKVLVVPGWFSNTILVAYPNLRRLNQIRMSVDRQKGELEGVMLNEEEESLGSFLMSCEAVEAGDRPKTKF